MSMQYATLNTHTITKCRQPVIQIIKYLYREVHKNDKRKLKLFSCIKLNI